MDYSNFLMGKTGRFSLFFLLSALISYAGDGYAFAAENDEYVAKIGERCFYTLQEAFNEVEQGSPTTIFLLKDVADGDGFELPEKVSGKQIVMDFDNHSYVVTKNLVGPSEPQKHAVYFSSGNSVTMKNGTLSVAPHLAEYMIENHADLEMDYMTVDATNVIVQEDVIDCWGDSQTGGAAGVSSWVSLVAKMAGYTLNGGNASHSINNRGNGGDSSTEIAIRYGSLPLYINPCVISKSNTTRTDCTVFAENGGPVKNLGTLWADFNPATVDGISCYIRNPNKSDQKTIVRVKNGSADHEITEPTRVVMPVGLYGRDRITIIMTGANKGYGGTYESYIKIIDDMIDLIPSNEKRYIIIPSYTVAFVEPMGMTISEVEERMAERYGEHFLNIRKYLIENGLSENGISPTSTDLSQINKGMVPKSLKAEGDFHLNQYGMASQAKAVYAKLMELGYLKNQVDEEGMTIEYGFSRPAVCFYEGGSKITNTTIKLNTSDQTGMFIEGAQLSMGTGTVVNGLVTVAMGNVEITDGKYNGKVFAGNETGLQISGGTFVNPVLEKDCAEGFIPYDKKNGTYTVVKTTDAVIELSDGETYSYSSDWDVADVAYMREFTESQKGNYQAWFVPVDYKITGEEKAEFYSIELVSSSEENDDLTDVALVYLQITRLSAGDVMTANTPYVIRPLEAGRFVFHGEGGKMYAKNLSSILSFFGTNCQCDFYGVYDGLKASEEHEWMAMSGGHICWNESDAATLGTYRWYIKISSAITGQDFANIRFEFVENTPTDIISVVEAHNEPVGYYSLDGVKHDKTFTGLNILKFKNGNAKKIFVK